MLSHHDLLRETERAAGHEQLSAWHDVLIQEGKTCKVAQEVRQTVPNIRDGIGSS